MTRVVIEYASWEDLYIIGLLDEYDKADPLSLSLVDLCYDSVPKYLDIDLIIYDKILEPYDPIFREGFKNKEDAERALEKLLPYIVMKKLTE